MDIREMNKLLKIIHQERKSNDGTGPKVRDIGYPIER